MPGFSASKFFYSGGAATTATPTATAPMPLDMETFEESRRLLGDKFPRLLGYFLEDTRFYIQQIETAVRERAAAPIVSASHSLKSSSHQFGAMALSELSRTIEEKARTAAQEGSFPDDLAPLAERLRKQADAIRPMLESCLTPEKNP